MKNAVYAVVIVVCFILVAVIVYKYIFTSGSGDTVDSIPEDQLIWVKCANDSCGGTYQTGKRAYFKFIEENAQPMSPSAPPLTCEKCGEQSGYRAEKCTNSACGTVFFRGAVPNDFADRCPECDKSETEEIRKRRKAAG